MRLLVVEDEEGLVSALRSGLGRAGYAVDTAENGAVAMEKLATTAYDLAILDITLPDTSGLDLCRAVRRGEIEVASGRELRVLMLTARASLADRVRGLDEGADDYLTKPFALVELLARIRALLRRDVTNGTTQLHVGDLVLDSSRHLATRAGRELPLTLKEFGVLRYPETKVAASGAGVGQLFRRTFVRVSRRFRAVLMMWSPTSRSKEHSMNLPGKRLLLGTAIATAALGVGGIAYAAGSDDPAPEQGYVTVEDGATTPGADPSTAPGQGHNGTGAQRDGRDCPEKNGSGTESPGAEDSQPQTQPDPQSNA